MPMNRQDLKDWASCIQRGLIEPDSPSDNVLAALILEVLKDPPNAEEQSERLREAVRLRKERKEK